MSDEDVYTINFTLDQSYSVNALNRPYRAMENDLLRLWVYMNPRSAPYSYFCVFYDLFQNLMAPYNWRDVAIYASIFYFKLEQVFQIRSFMRNGMQIQFNRNLNIPVIVKIYVRHLMTAIEEIDDETGLLNQSRFRSLASHFSHVYSHVIEYVWNKLKEDDPVVFQSLLDQSPAPNRLYNLSGVFMIEEENDMHINIETSTIRHSLDQPKYRNMLERVCNTEMYAELDDDYVAAVKRLYGIRSTMSRRRLCRTIQDIQIREQTACENSIDAFSQESIHTIPVPFRYKLGPHCFNILDLATQDQVSQRNPYTRQPFSRQVQTEIQNQLSLLTRTIQGDCM